MYSNAFALARVGRDADQDLLPERVLRVLGNPDLLFDRTHQLLVGLDLLFGDRILHLLLVAKRFDVVEIVVAQILGHLFERVDKRTLHFDLGDLVVFAARERIRFR